MKTIPLFNQDENDPEKGKEPTLLDLCKYYKGEDVNPFKDSSSAEFCLWDIERVAVREASLPSSMMLENAMDELKYVSLPESVIEAVPAPVLQVAYVHFGKQVSTPHGDPNFAVIFVQFLGSLYGSNFV